jgi:hypothetical protein
MPIKKSDDVGSTEWQTTAAPAQTQRSTPAPQQTARPVQTSQPINPGGTMGQQGDRYIYEPPVIIIAPPPQPQATPLPPYTPPTGNTGGTTGSSQSTVTNRPISGDSTVVADGQLKNWAEKIEEPTSGKMVRSRGCR